MPCYNAAATLPEALESLRRQTLSDYELIIVEDGSTDATLQLIEDQASKDARLRIIPSVHQGIIAALNAGLEACSAPYVARRPLTWRLTPRSAW
jgi:glycosyltransferase involved in cell wall biosynthesis